MSSEWAFGWGALEAIGTVGAVFAALYTALDAKAATQRQKAEQKQAVATIAMATLEVTEDALKEAMRALKERKETTSADTGPLPTLTGVDQRFARLGGQIAVLGVNATQLYIFIEQLLAEIAQINRLISPNLDQLCELIRQSLKKIEVMHSLTKVMVSKS